MYLLLAKLLRTSVALLGLRLAEGPEGAEVAFLLCDFPGCLGDDGGRERESKAGGGGSEVVTSRITLLWLTSLLGEEDQTVLVCRQALNVDGLSLHAQVPPAVVDNDTQALGLFAPDSSFLQFGKCEATALTDFGVVSHGLCADSGAEELERSYTQCGGLGDTGISSAELTSGLVEPCLDTALPVLAEMIAVED